MPPKRKSGGGHAATRGAQSTLSFNSRVTKPSATSNSSTKDLGKKIAASEQQHSEEPEKVQIVVPPASAAEDDKEEKDISETEEVDIKGVKAEVVRLPKKSIEKSKGEVDAEKVTDVRIKKYWKKEEESRLAPRGMSRPPRHRSSRLTMVSFPVHQRSLTTNEKILRHFDLSTQYGPCIGISRMKRWKRAEGLGLNPPVEVMAVLLREQEEDRKKKKGEEGGWKRAYIEELLEGRTAIVE